MRVRLRRLLTLVSGGREQLGGVGRSHEAARPYGAGQSRPDASRPDEVPRRLDAARQRLKQTIPPPEDAAR